MRSLALSAAVLLAIPACYDPAEVDCTVSCAAATDCAGDQVCGSDGFCAAPSVAGHCGSGPDAGAAAQVSLKITIDGAGKVAIDGVGSCDDTAPGHSCVFSVTSGKGLSLKATKKGDHDFRGWSGGCAGTSTSCSLTPITALTQVGARFE